MPGARSGSLNLVAVASEPPRRRSGAALCPPPPPVSFRLQASRTDPRRVWYTRVAASTLCALAAWLRRRSGKAGVHAMTAGAIGLAPAGSSNLPSHFAAIRGLLERDEYTGPDGQAVAAAIAALRSADALIVGPMSPGDANTPGLLPHLADVAGRAYRALRPPREIIAHPGFAQVARRFDFLQMSHQEARALGAGGGRSRHPGPATPPGPGRSRRVRDHGRRRPWPPLGRRTVAGDRPGRRRRRG